ncbi:hypothetical protein C9J21_21195 [Photobacterium phosphoreum]|uniref:SDR family NAD(P)-dependent oxidoreductase n=1 Tax=Photobacterium phosphoreum TaxID=659 RepID=UPI000D15A489|nr:SDR family oxidoreductase [Photobacterium phosphoreum]PSW27624.1 hypothetical protein C9J21_21195 [Photobacterium phosphoreum]
MKAIVTGSNSGIGLHCFNELHKRGFNVHGIDINYNNQEHENKYQCDLSDPDKARNVFDKIGDYDYAINCACISGVRKRFKDIQYEEYLTGFSDIISPFLNSIINEVRIYNLNTNKKKIINIASSTAMVGGVNMSIYSSAKAAMINLTKVIAMENSPTLIVNSISPATIDTPMIRRKYNNTMPNYSNAYPVGSCGNVNDVFSVIDMMIKNDFMTGQNIVLDGGYSSLFELKLK